MKRVVFRDDVHFRWSPYAGLMRDDTTRNTGTVERNGDVPDLQTQFEDLLHSVWLAEQEWRLDDRIDLATSYVPPRIHRPGRRSLWK